MTGLRFCLLITGTRSAADAAARSPAARVACARLRTQLFEETLGPIRSSTAFDHLVVIHGAQRGIDQEASAYMRTGQRRFKTFREIAIPYFDELGPKGGHERSRLLVDLYAAFLAHTYQGEIHAYPGPKSPGTWGTVQYAKKLGFEPAAHLLTGDLA